MFKSYKHSVRSEHTNFAAGDYNPEVIQSQVNHKLNLITKQFG